MANTYMSRQVFPQAPSPTMTSLRRISAIVRVSSERALGGSGEEEQLRKGKGAFGDGECNRRAVLLRADDLKCV